MLLPRWCRYVDIDFVALAAEQSAPPGKERGHDYDNKNYQHGYDSCAASTTTIVCHFDPSILMSE
jgi:hypothetical protein